MQYLVERYLPGTTLEGASETSQRLTRAAIAQAASADGIRYLGSIFIPDEEWCLSLFEGGTEDALRGLLQKAALPYVHIAVAQVVGP